MEKTIEEKFADLKDSMNNSRRGVSTASRKRRLRRLVKNHVANNLSPLRFDRNVRYWAIEFSGEVSVHVYHYKQRGIKSYTLCVGNVKKVLTQNEFLDIVESFK